MERSKLQSYLGFCVRARKIVFGVDNIEKERKGVYLLLCDEALGESSFKTMRKAQENLACPLLIAEKEVLGAALYRPAVKAAAIKDKHLAKAIENAAESEPQFKLYSGGNN